MGGLCTRPPSWSTTATFVKFCAIVGYSSRVGRDREKFFYRLPAIIEKEGGKLKNLPLKKSSLALCYQKK